MEKLKLKEIIEESEMCEMASEYFNPDSARVMKEELTEEVYERLQPLKLYKCNIDASLTMCYAPDLDTAVTLIADTADFLKAGDGKIVVQWSPNYEPMEYDVVEVDYKQGVVIDISFG